MEHEAFEDAALVAREQVRVIGRLVEGGKTVTKRTPSIQLDPNDYELALQQAEMRFSATNASLTEAQQNFDRGQRLGKENVLAR